MRAFISAGESRRSRPEALKLNGRAPVAFHHKLGGANSDRCTFALIHVDAAMQQKVPFTAKN
jgi:hypothetical protein